jgi:peptide subunit release factor 1 (eRF1)
MKIAVEFLHSEYKKILGSVLVTPQQVIEMSDALEKAKEMEKEQSNAKIQKAIEKFEELQSKASSLKDVIYLGGVLSALEGIKNETFKQQQ